MARQKYEDKHTISIIGTLNKVEDGKYMVTVENGDSFKEYSLNKKEVILNFFQKVEIL